MSDTTRIKNMQRALNQAGANIIVDGVMGSQTRAAEAAYLFYQGDAPVHDLAEIIKSEPIIHDMRDEAFLPLNLRLGMRVYQCPYCGCWSDNDIGLCEHCGAPKE